MGSNCALHRANNTVLTHLFYNHTFLYIPMNYIREYKGCLPNRSEVGDRVTLKAWGEGGY